MDLIYIILSLYLRLFQTALPLSRSSVKSGRIHDPGQPWAVWIPVVGWVSVTVRYQPFSRWLAWRVTAVQRLSEAPRPKQKPSWPKKTSCHDDVVDPSKSAPEVRRSE